MKFAVVTITPRRKPDGSGPYYHLTVTDDAYAQWVKVGNYESLSDVLAAFSRPLRHETEIALISSLRSETRIEFGLRDTFEQLV